jgi:hypothetical protein
VQRNAIGMLIVAMGLGGLMLQSGCRNDAPSAPRMPVPSASNSDTAREHEYIKPLGRDDWRDRRDVPPPPPIEPTR